MSKFKLSNYTVITEFLENDTSEKSRIIYSTRTAKALIIADSIIQKLLNNDFNSISNEALLKLINMELIVPEDQIEFNEIIAQNRVSLNDTKTLEVTMQPGANCQLGCHYCGQVHSKNSMTETIYDSVIKRITHNLGNKNYEGIYMTWYGGEPLTALKQIRELTSKLKDLTTEKKLSYSAGMITNGLSLKLNIFEELVTKHDITFFQITIDGTKEHHDKRRITKKGEKTYDIIFKHILDITSSPLWKEKKCTLLLRINIDSTNYESVIPFLNILAEHQLQSKIILHFATITNWGGNNAGEVSLTKEDFADIEIDWFIHAKNLGFYFNVMPGRVYQTCMVVDKDQEVYDAYGNIYPCWEFPYTPKYEKGEYLVGNVTKPYDTYNEHAKTRDWYDEVSEGTTWCLKCNLFPICGGACPKSWYEGTPPCPPFKNNLEDRLILQHLMGNNKIDKII